MTDPRVGFRFASAGDAAERWVFLSFSWRIVCWTYLGFNLPPFFRRSGLPSLVSTSHGPCQPHAMGHRGGEYSVATVATTTGTRNILDITLPFQETKK